MSDNRAQPDAPAGEDAREPKKKRHVVLTKEESFRLGRPGWSSRGYIPHYDVEGKTQHAWCVMPNHVHTIFTPHTGWAWSEIAGSWRSFTAKQCNRALGRAGRFWQRDPFDRYIRDQEHFGKTLRYIEDNPVKARLCDKPEDWPWSSAYWRKKKEEESG